MKKLMCGVSAVTLAMTGVVATPALAENTLNGNLSFELGRNIDKSRNFKHIATSLGTTFDNGVGLQLDISVGKYEQVTSTQPTAGLHVYYAPSDDWAIGAFLTGEDQRPGNYAYFGVEAAYTSGPFMAEVYAAYRNDRASTFDGERFGVEMAYAPDNWGGFGIFGGGHSESGLPGGSKSIVYVGGDYRFANDTKLALTYGRTNLDESVVTLGYHINFGRGATFSRRHSQGVFDGY
ncbi:hypothetical protein [Pseudooceanicola onchidii]|uniref:hypothetical protein n=1 Tax=Pseudooceanicola onchidii TaxID=2562279 RepID=UPI0010AACFD7|nr:hypothetical protein [Pseudooceanicola onchidii]